MLIPRNNEYDWFDNFMGDVGFQRRNNLMKTDIREYDNKYQLEVDVPGFKKENLKVELNNGYLTVSATSESINDDEEDNHYIHRERNWGKCSRSFYIGNKVNGEDVQANFKDGTLYINYPKNNEKDNENKIINIE